MIKEVVYTCDLCEKKYKRLSNIVKHIKDKHQKDIKPIMVLENLWQD